eukprot:gene8581-10559_t
MIQSSSATRLLKNILKRNSLNYYCTVSKYSEKKILIQGDDVAGLALALFLKRRGISSELYETTSPVSTDHGIYLTDKCQSILKKYKVDELKDTEKIRHSSLTTFRGAVVDHQKHEEQEKQNQKPTPISISNVNLKKQLIHEISNKFEKGQGKVKINRAGSKIKSVIQKSPELASITIANINSAANPFYDLVIGASTDVSVDSSSSADGNGTDPIRQCLIAKESEPFPFQYHHFTTVINRPSVYPPVSFTSVAPERILVSYPLPNDKLAISGTFKKSLFTKFNPDKAENPKSSIIPEYVDFEDITPHLITNIIDTAPEQFQIYKSPSKRLKNYANGNICVIGDAADYFSLDYLKRTEIGLMDADHLAECLVEEDSIPKALDRFNREKKLRMVPILNSIDKAHNMLFNGNRQWLLFKNYFIKKNFNKYLN